MGSRWLRHALHHPLRDRAVLRARHGAVAALLAAGAAAARARAAQSAASTSSASPRASRCKSARPRDLSGLCDTLKRLPELAAHARRAAPARACASSRRRSRRTTTIADAARLRDRPEPAAVLREGGVIADGYDAELDELRAIQNNCGQFLLDLETRERARSGIANLKVEYNRVHGFYIEVTRAQTREGARRLPPPPDAEERRALHHARAEGLRGQGALGAGARARAREAALRRAARRARAARAGAAAHRALRSPSSMCSRRSPSARPRSTGTRPSSSTSR